jgi:cellulose synthase/poly-beta-1,6-N-acetylglucosamine synthase-like glycosyltransferase
LGFTNWAVTYIKLQHQHCTTNKFSGAIAEEKEDFCKGSLSLPIFLLFCFILFLLASFYQKYKKISSYFKLLFMSSLVSVTMSFEEMIFTFKQKGEESFKEAWSRIYDCHGKTEPKMTLS